MSKALNPQLLPGRITAAHCSLITKVGLNAENTFCCLCTCSLCSDYLWCICFIRALEGAWLISVETVMDVHSPKESILILIHAELSYHPKYVFPFSKHTYHFFYFHLYHRVICLGCELENPGPSWKEWGPPYRGNELCPYLCVLRGKDCSRGHNREKQCHITVNVMYRHRHTVHLTMFFVLKKIFTTSYLTVIFFLLEKGK